MRRYLPFITGAWLVSVAACVETPVQVRVSQPIEFPHSAHVAQFTSGRHRADRIAMHLKIFGTEEPPQELAEGKCAACHDDLAERQACAGCHVPFQNDALRANREVRPCVGCHRGAWASPAATIPSATVCLSCHEAGMRLVQGGSEPKIVLVRAGDTPPEPALEDVPWVRINTMPPNVYFSHTAHVRFASMACTECHQDVSGLLTPPDKVRVFTMSECLTCHTKRGAGTDCLTCHK